MCGAHRGSPRHGCGGADRGPACKGNSRLVLELELEKVVGYLGPTLARETNILSLHAAAGKLQQEGGISPLGHLRGGEAAQPRRPGHTGWGYAHPKDSQPASAVAKAHVDGPRVNSGVPYDPGRQGSGDPGHPGPQQQSPPSCLRKDASSPAMAVTGSAMVSRPGARRPPSPRPSPPPST